jgi:hypothetical protein
VTHDIVLMHFVAAAIEEKLGQKRGSKKTEIPGVVLSVIP